MALVLRTQALALICALAAGIALGLLYDLLRPLRRRSARPVAAALDVAFAVMSFSAAFSLAMCTESGRLGQWELAAMLAGFLIYLHAVGDRVCARIDGWMDGALHLARRAENLIKKFAEMAKFLFHKVRECFIIKGT